MKMLNGWWGCLCNTIMNGRHQEGVATRLYQMLMKVQAFGNYRSTLIGHSSVGLHHNGPLPCCGCGIGWWSFLMGFVFPLFWYYGAFRFFAPQYRSELRERPGLAACVVAAFVNTVALATALLLLFLQHWGSKLSTISPPPPEAYFW